MAVLWPPRGTHSGHFSSPWPPFRSTGAASEAARGAHPVFTLPRGGKSEVFGRSRCGLYMVNNRSKPHFPFFKKELILGSILPPFASCSAPFCHLLGPLATIRGLASPGPRVRPYASLSLQRLFGECPLLWSSGTHPGFCVPRALSKGIEAPCSHLLSPGATIVRNGLYVMCSVDPDLNIL